MTQATVNEQASKYLAVETVGSCICNALLNLASAIALFHGKTWIPATGPKSLLQDSIGEAFIVAFLSVLIPSLIARRRRRAGALPKREHRSAVKPRNPYLQAVLLALLFTVAGVSINALLLPRLYPGGVSHSEVIVFKTVFGTVIGTLATILAVHRVLNESE